MIKIVSNDVILSKLILAALAAPNDSPVLITGVSYVDPSGTDAADVAITTSFGTTWWKNFTVVSDEVAAGKPAVAQSLANGH
jgi:hypothetical protein